MALDIYQAVTDRILSILDQGVAPWRQPIRGTGSEGLLPTNLASLRAYRGINVFLLAMTSWAEGFSSPYWMTYRQAAAKGGHVRKGEKGSLVIFWKQYATRDKKTDEPIKVLVLRHYTVFNAEQCEGIELPSPTAPAESETEQSPFEPIETCAAIVAGYAGGPAIEHRGSRACYRPRTDTVQIAEPERFESGESYYATLFHELAHSTGHSKRLNRGLDRDLKSFGSPDYSREELIAEFASAFLSAAAGIGGQTVEQSAAYIDGWRKKLRSDKKIAITAAGAGQRATDLILGPAYDSRPQTSEPA